MPGCMSLCLCLWLCFRGPGLSSNTTCHVGKACLMRHAMDRGTAADILDVCRLQ